MPKLSAARWPIGIVLALLAIAAVSLSWGSPQALRLASPLAAIAALFAGDEFAGERRELRFWQEALERIAAELQQRTNALMAASLRTERETIMERVREVAGRMPRDSLPPEIRRLIEPEALPAPAPALAARPPEQAAPTRP